MWFTGESSLQKPLPDTLSRPSARGWAWLPLAAALMLGVVWLILAFSEPFGVQDDARQHAVWFEAARDPELFADDFIAAFFVGNNTPVFKALYALPASLGISPLLLTKLYPVPLTLLTAWLAFRFLLGTGIRPVAAALGAVLFVQGIWVSDDIASATARAFSWPMLMAVLVCWRENRAVLGAALGVVLSLTYPSAAVFAGGMIGLVCLAKLLDGKKTLADLRALWTRPAIVVAGLFLGALAALATGTGGDVVSAAEARRMAEFDEGGRTAFFLENPITYWLLAKRSGALPEPVLRHVLLVAAVALAALRWQRLPLAARRLSLAAIIAGLILWAAAHATLFTLYLPGRYSLIGERVAFCVLAGAGLAAWLPSQPSRLWKGLAAALVALPLLALLVPPRTLTLISVPEAPRLMAALGETPKNSLVAGFSRDLDDIPASSLRRVLTAREYHLPYDMAYALAMRDRLADTAAAVFASGPEGVEALVQRYGVTHLLIERGQVTPQGARQSWWWPILAQDGRQPDCSAEACRVWVLEQPRCVVAEQAGHVLLSAACLLAPAPAPAMLPSAGNAGAPRPDGAEPRPAAG